MKEINFTDVMINDRGFARMLWDRCRDKSVSDLERFDARVMYNNYMNFADERRIEEYRKHDLSENVEMDDELFGGNLTVKDVIEMIETEIEERCDYLKELNAVIRYIKGEFR